MRRCSGGNSRQRPHSSSLTCTTERAVPVVELSQGCKSRRTPAPCSHLGGGGAGGADPGSASIPFVSASFLISFCASRHTRKSIITQAPSPQGASPRPQVRPSPDLKAPRPLPAASPRQSRERRAGLVETQGAASGRSSWLSWRPTGADSVPRRQYSRPPSHCSPPPYCTPFPDPSLYSWPATTT